MLTLWGTCVLYVAVFAFYQSGQRRTVFAELKSSQAGRRAVRGAGWGLAALALLIMARPQGWERGIPIWLAAFMLAAFGCLLVGSLFPKHHTSSAVLASVCSVVLGASIILGANS
ncbi:MAG: DUF3325 family protein [Pseudomonadota bacterium]